MFVRCKCNLISILNREIILTSDGSSTIYLPEWNEHYHSKHGAIQEANYVYLDKGLHFYISEQLQNENNEVNVLEMGFGTGLNAYLTLLYAEKHKIIINYTAIEAFPVLATSIQKLNYTALLHQTENSSLFQQLHDCEWESFQAITPYFNLKKQHKTFHQLTVSNVFNVVYFDAFGPRVQPELWTATLFNKMYNALKIKGVLTTYCAQGNARRAMMQEGFTVTKLVGPPGKRHMLRALKL